MPVSDYAPKELTDQILPLLTPENRLICEIMAVTGLRVGDVVRLTTEQVRAVSRGWLVITEQKTGKRRSVRFPHQLRDRCLAMAGQRYIFPNARDPQRHRTRHAVGRQLAACRAGLTERAVSPHTFRKQYAVEKFKRIGDVFKIQRDFGHTHLGTTLIYVTADKITESRLRDSKRKGKK